MNPKIWMSGAVHASVQSGGLRRIRSRGKQMSLIGPIANHTNDAQSLQAFPTDYSDDSLALWFAQNHAHDLRYVARKRLWYLWDAKRWREDDTLRVPDEVRRICRAAADACGDPKIATASKVAAVERLAKSDRRLAATVDQWDANRWLLNTPAGAVDLETGKLRPHLSEDYCTKTTAVSPGGECPLWKGFLEQTFGGDAELICFVQRVCGYALTGATHEHALFFCYGTGANGKGTLINTVVGILGDYARVAPVETFTASSTDRHPTELAMLMGARLVTAQETEEGRPWAEAKIKAITGGDPITARRMRQDFFTFTPQLKLMIAGNHRPSVRSVDEAIRRRIHIIPFRVTVPPNQRDPDLPGKLKLEWSGILSWMIEGCFL